MLCRENQEKKLYVALQNNIYVESENQGSQPCAINIRSALSLDLAMSEESTEQRTNTLGRC